MAAVGSVVRPELQPSRELQKTLTQPLHCMAIHWLWTNAEEPTRQRLNSLTTPHALAWLASNALTTLITQGEFVAGLKWVSGLKFRDEPYPCRHCGLQADPYGVHATTCQRSGSISRGHTTLRDTVADLLAKAGVSAATEQRLPDSLDRPADVLLSSWRGRTVAMDFTVITPTRPSSSLSSTSTTTLMDQAAHQKEQKSRRQCEEAGWAFQPFVADTYGALRADARAFVTRFIKRYSQKFAPLDEAEAGRAIWCTISTAIISRAAQQLCRTTSADRPLGLPLHQLNLHSLRSTSSTISTAATLPLDMGINHNSPSQDGQTAEYLFDFEQEGARCSSRKSEEQPSTAIEANTHEVAHTTHSPPILPAACIPISILVQSAINGEQISLSIAPNAHLTDVQDLMVSKYGVHSASYNLSLGHVPITAGTTLAEQGVSEHAVLLLQPARLPAGQ